MTDHPVYYHVRIKYAQCSPTTQRQTFCAKLRTVQNFKKSTPSSRLVYGQQNNTLRPKTH